MYKEKREGSKMGSFPFFFCVKNFGGFLKKILRLLRNSLTDFVLSSRNVKLDTIKIGNVKN